VVHREWFDVHVERGLTMEARDGVRLGMDIYRPRRNGSPVDDSFPVIVERTPYDRGRTPIVLAAQYFVRRGYAFVAQDVRGRGDSGGSFHHLLNRPDEGVDGFDTLTWIMNQPVLCEKYIRCRGRRSATSR
jgi:putative CocE/NonD family hydrolase